MGVGILGVLVTPLRLARRIAVNLLQFADSSYALALPVAGLDEEAAHQILSTLKAAERDDVDPDLPADWLSALELVQIASDRLIWDLSRVEKSLEFWSERLRQGQHLRTMLFGQGPVSFAKDVGRVVSRRQSTHSPSDRIERRVIILRDLRTKLAESLAQVHAAASLLHLKAAKIQDGSNTEDDFDPVLLERIARQAIQDSCTLTAKAFKDVQEYSREKLQGLENATPDLRQTALAQMLKLHSKRMFKFGSNGSALDLSLEPVDETNESQDAEDDDSVAQVNKKRHVGSSEAVEQLQQLLDADIDIDATTSAHNALSQANAIASVQRHVIDLPKWLRMPNKLTRQWIMYSFIGLGVGYAGIFLIRHSRLVGSKDMEQWGAQAARAVADAYQQHILRPLLAVRDELFQTFRQKRSIVSTGDYEADKESLVRMLEDFRKDNNGSSQPADAETAQQELEVKDANMTHEQLKQLRDDLDFMMMRYEGELKQPIRNVVTGKLPRTMLIQVQKLKVDLEAAMLQLDQILRANELNVALVAAIPAFIAAGLTIVGLVRWLTPTPPDPRWEALPCRMAMVEVERAVQALSDGESAEEQGLLIYRLAIVYKEAVTLFRRHKLDSNTPHSEWQNMRADLVHLAAPRSVQSKSRIVKRMMRVYTIFRI